MATESLIVELDARTQKLEDKLKSTDSKLTQLSTTTNKTSGSYGNLSKVNSAVASGLGTTVNVAKKAAGAFLAVKAAVTAATAISARYAKEIKNNSDLMKLSVEETQALASATQTVGIDMDKLGDISKDVSEKIGQMLTMGGGGFEDFGDAMGMTKEETIKDWFIHQFWPTYPGKWCRSGKGGRQEALNAFLKKKGDADPEELRRILGNLKAQIRADQGKSDRKWWVIGKTYCNN